jgi:hypothetical protein
MNTSINITQSYFKGYTIGLIAALKNFEKNPFLRKKVKINLFKNASDIEFLKGYNLGYKNGKIERA